VAILIIIGITVFYFFRRFTEGEKKEIIKSGFIVVIAFLVTFTTMSFSFYSIHFIIMNEVFADIIAIVVWNRLNLLIYKIHPARKSVIIFKRDLKSATVALSILFMLVGFVAHLIFVIGFYEEEVLILSEIAIGASTAGLVVFLIALKRFSNVYKEFKTLETENQNLIEEKTYLNEKLRELNDEIKKLIADKKVRISAVEEDLKSIFNQMGISNKGKTHILFVIKYFLKNPPTPGNDIIPNDAYKVLSKKTESIRKTIDYAIWRAWHKTHDKILKSLYKKDYDEDRGYPFPKEFITYFLDFVNENYEIEEIANMIYEPNVTYEAV